MHHRFAFPFFLLSFFTPFFLFPFLPLFLSPHDKQSGHTSPPTKT